MRGGGLESVGAVLAVLLWGGAVWGQVFVAVGAAAPGLGTAEAPFATLDHALDAFASGGRIVVAPGEYGR